MLARLPRQLATRAAAAAVIVGGLLACTDSHRPTGPAAAIAPPTLTGFGVAPNPFNVLSAVVTFTATGVDSARLVYTTPGDTAAATPYSPVQGDSGRLVALGLLPNAAYTYRLQLVGAGRSATETFQFTTGALPAYVQTATLKITGAFGRGYTMISPIFYNGDSVLAVAFDSRGRVRWYRTFPPGTGGVESKQQPNGHFTIALGGSAGDDEVPVQYAEFLPSGELVATYDSPPGEFMDSHDLLMTGTAANPILHFFGYTLRPFDFSPLGGPSNGIGIGHQLIRQSPPGTTQFLWDAWDHYSIADWIEPTGVNPPNDFDHSNSLTFDLDSNYVASFRHMGAVVKLDVQTGTTIWQLGGRLGQFTILKDPLGLFSGQHCVRVLDNGDILMYDNGLRHNPQHTRAVEYALDLTKMTATMVWEYEPNPSIFTAAVGSVQRLSSGHTLVGFGLVGQVHEVDAQSHVVGTALFNLKSGVAFYRATRIVSLYQYLKP